MRYQKIVMLTLAAGVAVGCSSQDAEDGAIATTDSLGTVATPAETTWNDAQIAAVVLAANTADSAGGVLAQANGTHADVKAFGALLVTDHSALNKKATDIATAAGMTPEESDASRKMREDAASHMASLQGKTGADFDKAFMDHAVTMHQGLLDMLDQKLIAGAQHAELKQLLTDARPAVAAHLDAAKGIQTKLNQ